MKLYGVFNFFCFLGKVKKGKYKEVYGKVKRVRRNEKIKY